MTAIAGQDFWQEQADEPEVRIDARVRPDQEDAYWQRVFWAQPYHRAGYGYDDYAPAYCVGYIGYAQYGGCFEDAEKSLCANWVRIKGDSRLEIDVAMEAIRAAWEHAALAAVQGKQDEFEQEICEELFAVRARPTQQPAYATA
jgi:hypothetical protein